MATRSLVAAIAAFIVIGVSAEASAWGPNKMGAIGDSLSTGMDANDDCDTLTSCASRLGEDRGYSWTTGYATSESFRNRLGLGSTNEQQYNGARWDDGLAQANALLSAGGAAYVSIELGGNDVCRPLNATLPTKAAIKNHIHNTLNTLVNAPSGQRPHTIIIGEAPDVVHLRDTMRNQKNFAFESCQGLWDLDASKIEVNTCDWGFFDFLCDIADFIIEVTADFLDPLADVLLDAFNVEFPCGYVLSSGSNATKRGEARGLNIDINAAIAEEVAHHQGVNGVTIRLASNVYEYQFVSGEVSQLDCFHPNRRGQKNLSKTVWTGADMNTVINPPENETPSRDTTAPTVDSMTVGWFDNAQNGYPYDLGVIFNTNENARLDLKLQKYTMSGSYLSSYYPGKTDETPTAHEVYLKGTYEGSTAGLSWDYCWMPLAKPTDTSGNTSSGYWGPVDENGNWLCF